MATYTKQDCINGIMWFCECSKTTANKIYNNIRKSEQPEVVFSYAKSFKDNAKRCFYDD
jgi:hypothetical protein